MAEAYSGSEARDFVSGAQSGVPTGPYRQSYQYSSFNQVTQQTNRLWDHNEVATNTVVNNRRQYWSYDADGAVIYADNTTYTRDAAGRNTKTDSETSHGTYTFDGDGNALKTVLTTPGFRGGTRTTTVYYLRSSVLGAAVAELNSVGLKMKRYVYAGGRKLAEEFGGNFTWSHAEPVTGSRGDSTTAGAYIPKAEFNADGVNVGFEPPESNGFDSPEPIAPWGNVGLSSNCSVGNPNCLSCYLDGFEHNCGQVMRLAEAGALKIRVENRQGDFKYVDVEVMLGGLYVRDRYERTHGERTDNDVFVLTQQIDLIQGWFMPIADFVTNGERRFAHASQETRLQIWQRIHKSCVDDFLGGLASNRVPSSMATSDIMGVAFREGADETLLAVTWTSESEFSSSPGSNGNARDSKGVIHEDWIKQGNADIGPMQINYNTWHSWSGLSGLTNVFGSTTTGYKSFDGDYYANLRAGARILKDLNSRHDRAGAAGRYRTGEGDFFSSAKGQAAFTDRRNRFNTLRRKYDDFFKCIKDRR